MVQINDDYYEDLTPETTRQLITALRDSAKATSGASTEGASKTAAAKKVPAPGPLSGRQSCEHSGGQTNLTSQPWGTETTRSDL